MGKKTETREERRVRLEAELAQIEAAEEKEKFALEAQETVDVLQGVLEENQIEIADDGSLADSPEDAEAKVSNFKGALKVAYNTLFPTVRRSTGGGSGARAPRFTDAEEAELKQEILKGIASSKGQGLQFSNIQKLPEVKASMEQGHSKNQIRSLVQSLFEDGKIKSEGQASATTYFAT